MPQDRRRFLRKLSAVSGAALLTPSLLPAKAQLLAKELIAYDHLSPEEAARDESYWAKIRLAYAASPNLINLNNGGVSPHPRAVQEKLGLYNELSNEVPGFYMWRTLGRLRPQIKRKLADLGGCQADEIAIMRNATEALETVILGLDLKEGDEILTTDQDYPSILNTLELRVRRSGLKLKKISLPTPIEDNDEIVKRFAEAIGPRTKAMLFCHIINMTGQVLPARELCALARERGIYSIVDGAHSFAHLEFKISDLGADFYATSLHKWLSAPFGTGMLQVRKERIAELWPLYGYPEEEHNQISKFEHQGTRSFPSEMAISEAIDFHNMIGTARKRARLRYLREYWESRCRKLPTFKVLSPTRKPYACGISAFQLGDWQPAELSRVLVSSYQIYVTAFDHPAVKAVRITPHVYTSLGELDFLVNAIHELATQTDDHE
ncbi:MAG: aminotransferase class V-fold PLP-dependent enzyme [Bacteroidota bacterium]